MVVAIEVPSLIRLPAELLHHIFTLLTPSDLSTLCQTCRALNDHIDTSSHLWKQIYLQQWDPPSTDNADPLLTQPCPSTKTPKPAKDKGKSISEAPTRNGAACMKSEKKLFLDMASYSRNGTFDYRTQVQRRTWAELQLRNLNNKPFHLVSNYNDTMRTILSIARSRLSREASEDPETSASCQYLIDLLTSNAGYEVFQKLIYPRSDITRLRDWQRKTMAEKHGKASQEPLMKKVDGDKRNRSASTSNAVRDAKRRKTAAKEAAAPSRSRRRSARLLLHAYPAELHHLLFDKDGNDLIDLDNGQGIRSLEELELLDEQLAAELHVLHGIRPSKTSSKHMTISSTGEEALEQTEIGEEEEEEEAVFEDDEDDEEDDNDNEDDDEQHHHHHHHFHHHHHLPMEQPLGSETGYDGDTILRGRAREIVYDTANYGPENSYGPLRAWRERWDAIDGIRPEDRLRRRQEAETEAISVNDSSSSSSSEQSPGVSVIDLTQEDDAAEAPTDEGGVEQLYEVLQDVGWNPEWDPVDEFEEDMDDEEDDDDFDGDDEDVLMMEVREQDIALSHGLYPYHESRRLKHAMMEHNLKTGQQKNWSYPPAVNGSDSPKTLESVWRMEKRIDWVILEAVMVVMSCNLRHAIANHGWGRAFRLPGTNKSLTGQDAEARRLYASQAPDIFPAAWRNLLCLPCGWNHSRGDERRLEKEPEELAASASAEIDKDKQKPTDWASVESTWIGTYAFLDWSKWAAYNAKSPTSRGATDSSQMSDPCKPMPLKNSGTMSNLKHEREAVGDCLQLRMELLPLSEQKKTTPREEALQELEGIESKKYPPLRFKGSTVTYLEDGPPTLRGQVHGVVSPVFATQDEDYYASDGSKDRERAIVGLHWQLNHAYDGEDRWSLSGIQPGPPGSRAPIYGTWGASDRTDNLSPCGPFTYMKVSDMPWKEVDQLLQERR